MYALKSDVKKLKKQMVYEPFLSFVCDKNFNAKIMMAKGEREYVPEPTLLRLHTEIIHDRVPMIMGPYGSGKSTGVNWQILFLAAAMPKCKDGVRRCKVAVIRNTYDELKQTTFELWQSWFGELGDVKSTLKPLEIKHNFYDKNGRIELHLQFLALDKIQQYRKLRSSFFTFAYINEVSESPEGIIHQVLGRTGRYPSTDLIDTDNVKQWYDREILIDNEYKTIQVPYWSGVLCDTNPPEAESELFNIFEVDKPRGYKLYRQPPGLFKTDLGWSVNINAENIKRLELDYYSKQATGKNEEYIKVFCCGEYGVLKAGQLIYENYNDDIHCVDNLQLIDGLGLRLSFDTWYNPACNISQYANEQLRVLASLWEPHCSLETFIDDILKPYLNQNFHGIHINSVVFDPAGMQGELAAGATSDYQVLCKAFSKSGVNIVNKAPTNNIKPRHNAVEHLLKGMARGQPRLVMDKQRCNFLRQGFLKHYVWRQTRTTKEIIYDPKKNKYSHNQDALQYDALTVVGILDEHQAKPGTFLRPPVQRVQERTYAR